MVLTVLMASFVGSERIPLLEGLGIFWTWMTADGTDPASVAQIILLKIRLPRILLAGMTGAALAVVGATLQSLLRNPLADPYLLGVSSGAALGTTIAVFMVPSVTWMTMAVTPLLSFGGAFLALLLVYRLAISGGRLSVHMLLLAGVAVNAVISSFILLITALLDPVRTSRIVFWLMGNIGSLDYPFLWMLSGYLLVGIGILIGCARQFNLMTLGEESAQTLGADVERLKHVAFITTALLTGVVVAYTGPVGFVGILVPHILRFWAGVDNRLLLPASALVGGIFLILADTVARTALSPAEIPVGVVTALCGGPLFIYLLRTKKIAV
jgi:iron complex transport system permease protein